MSKNHRRMNAKRYFVNNEYWAFNGESWMVNKRPDQQLAESSGG